jgi:hypothetical protein
MKNGALYNDERRENIRHAPGKNGVVIDKKKLRDEFHAYFEKRRKRLEIVKTTRTPSGQILDWVPVDSQPGSFRPGRG